MKTILRIGIASLIVFGLGCAKKPAANNAPAAAEPAAMSACCKLDAAGAHSCQHGGGPCCSGHASK